MKHLQELQELKPNLTKFQEWLQAVAFRHEVLFIQSQVREKQKLLRLLEDPR